MEKTYPDQPAQEMVKPGKGLLDPWGMDPKLGLEWASPGFGEVGARPTIREQIPEGGWDPIQQMIRDFRDVLTEELDKAKEV